MSISDSIIDGNSKKTFVPALPLEKEFVSLSKNSGSEGEEEFDPTPYLDFDL